MKRSNSANLLELPELLYPQRKLDRETQHEHTIAEKWCSCTYSNSRTEKSQDEKNSSNIKDNKHISLIFAERPDRALVAGECHLLNSIEVESELLQA